MSPEKPLPPTSRLAAGGAATPASLAPVPVKAASAAAKPAPKAALKVKAEPTPPVRASVRGTGPDGKLTVEDLRRKAHSIQDLATEEVRDVVEHQRTRMIVAGAVTVAVVLSMAYLMGTRAGRRRAAKAAERAAARAAQAAEKAAESYYLHG